jgi:hypothetical protein
VLESVMIKATLVFSEIEIVRDNVETHIGRETAKR